MKTKAIQLIAIFLFSTATIFAQDVPESQVPSVIVNNFKKEFPKATDIEWERQGDQYKVEFEIGWDIDYDAWYNASGELIRYIMEISTSEIPEAVQTAIRNEYPGYRIDDAEKITENGVETYKVEVEKGKEEIDLVFSKDGKLLYSR